MFLLYHNSPLFSITRRTCPNVFLFGVQIPVDACTFLGLKRRSFLFVIDTKKHLTRGAFLTAERKQSFACGFSVRIGGSHSKSLVIKGFFHKAPKRILYLSLTTSKESGKRAAFAEIVRRGHSKKIDTKCRAHSAQAQRAVCLT